MIASKVSFMHCIKIRFMSQITHIEYTMYHLLIIEGSKYSVLFIFLYMQVLYYSTGLFINAGLPENAAKYATVGVGTVMVIMTLITIPLMDRKGRRTLQLYGLGGMFIFSIFVTITMLVKVHILKENLLYFNNKRYKSVASYKIYFLV